MMSTQAARRALDDNLRNYVTAQGDPVMYNICTALVNITKALDELDRHVQQVSQQVAHVEMKVRR